MVLPNQAAQAAFVAVAEGLSVLRKSCQVGGELVLINAVAPGRRPDSFQRIIPAFAQASGRLSRSFQLICLSTGVTNHATLPFVE
jgi:hypothetical protein